MSKMFDVSGELVPITGGTGTIGLAFGEALLLAGARVVLWSRGKSGEIGENQLLLTRTLNSLKRYYG